MVEVRHEVGTRPTYRATYSLGDDGVWSISVDTSDGEVRATAARLADVERRAYEAVRQRTGLPSSAFNLAFVHTIDLTAREPRTS
ncbi:MAG: hypothetical protein ACJ735_11870 [Actinomycetes bacterium]